MKNCRRVRALFDRFGRNYSPQGMKAVLSEKGQVTIPKPLRDRLGLRPGHILDFREERGRLVGIKQAPEDPVERVYGVLKTIGRTDATIRRLRGRMDLT